MCCVWFTHLKTRFHRPANQQWHQCVIYTWLNQQERSPRVCWSNIDIRTQWPQPFDPLSMKCTGEHGYILLRHHMRVEWRLRCRWLVNKKILCLQHGQQRDVWRDNHDWGEPSSECDSFGDLRILTSRLMSDDLPATWSYCYPFQTEPFVCTRRLGRIFRRNLDHLKGN